MPIRKLIRSKAGGGAGGQWQPPGGAGGSPDGGSDDSLAPLDPGGEVQFRRPDRLQPRKLLGGWDPPAATGGWAPPTLTRLESAATEIITALHQAKQELAREMEANLKQLKSVLEETQRIARDMEAVLREVSAEPDPKAMARGRARGGGWRPPAALQAPAGRGAGAQAAPAGRASKGGVPGWRLPVRTHGDQQGQGQPAGAGARAPGQQGGQNGDGPPPWQPPADALGSAQQQQPH